MSDDRKVGSVAVKCIGGCMNGLYVQTRVGTMFFRKVVPSGIRFIPDQQVHSYRLDKSGDLAEHVFRLEP